MKKIKKPTLNKQEMARSICEAAELSGYSGKRWGLIANDLHLYVDLAMALLEEIARFGYTANVVPLHDPSEACRLEGDSIIVVVERVVEKDGVGYDLNVFCRDKKIEPVIGNALKPIVTKYAEKNITVLKSFLDTDIQTEGGTTNGT